MKKSVIEILEEEDGTKVWFRDGKLHRDDGPAVECANGDKFWYRNGQLHRDDGPAVESSNGDNEWYHDGRRHRENGPAIERADGTKNWYRKGKLHRDDGPAIQYPDGQEIWFRNGEPIEPPSEAPSAPAKDFNAAAALDARLEQIERRLDSLERAPANAGDRPQTHKHTPPGP